MNKILFVAFPFSIHTVRWLNQIADGETEVHLYSSHRGAKPNPLLSEKIIYHNNPLKTDAPPDLIKRALNKIFPPKEKPSQEAELATLIKEIQPGIIHSLESQHAGYLVSWVKEKYFSGAFPFWIHSNWGIDLHFFGRLDAHLPRLKMMLSGIDLLIAEGKRDELLAREFGYTKEITTYPSVGGGFKIPVIEFVKPSLRKKILVKGTQDIVRRGLCAIRALERCADVLEGYELILYSSCYETETAAELFKKNTGFSFTILKEVSHDEMLLLTAAARVSICTNLSDGLPNAMLEAMMLGCFPVQSDTCISDGWIDNGRTGFLVPPEDTETIAAAIREAITNDSLVDEAAAENMHLIKTALDFEKTKSSVKEMYRQHYNKKQQP